MFPDLFSIGPLTIHTYGVFVAAGFFAGIMVTLKIGNLEGIDAPHVMDMGFYVILSALIGSRLMYALINISYYSIHPLEILKIWQGGLVFSGGFIGIFLTMAWYSKRRDLSLLEIGDLWAPAAAIGQGIGRIGCFMAGCCYGRPAGVKWSVVFTNPDSLAPLYIPLHPTQLYHSISSFIIFLILLWIHAKKKFEGQVFVWLLILHSTSRLLIERFRGDDRGMFLNTNMSITQFTATLILVASVITLLVLKPGAGKISADSNKQGFDT